MADTALVAKSHANTTTGADPVTSGEASVDSTKSTKPDPPTLPEAGPTALFSLGGLLNDRELSVQAAQLVLQSWRESTWKQYNPYIKRH